MHRIRARITDDCQDFLRRILCAQGPVFTRTTSGSTPDEKRRLPVIRYLGEQCSGLEHEQVRAQL
jgi:hypothetical protein